MWELGGGIFLHISSSWVKFRLHTKIWLCTLPGSALKVPVVVGGVKRKAVVLDEVIESQQFNGEEFNIELIESSLNKALATYRIAFSAGDNKDVFKYLHDAIQYMELTIHNARETKCSKGIKIVMSLKLNFHQASQVTEISDPAIVFHSEPFAVYAGTDVPDVLKKIETQLLKDIDIFERNGSGWVIHNIVELDTTIVECDPLRPSSYIELPREIKK